MIRILLAADIHGEIGKLSEFVKKAGEEKFDILVCPGDFTDMHNTPEGYSQDDVAEVVVQKLLSLGKPLLCVPGNHDPYDILEILDDYNVNLHDRVVKMKGKYFVGFGGAATPFNTKFEPSEKEIEESLERCVKKIKGKFILVTHNPPFGTRMDTTSDNKHVGSKAVRKFIEKTKPEAAFSAHIHEAMGKDKIGRTTIFYPGPIYEGRYGMIELGRTVRCSERKF